MTIKTVGFGGAGSSTYATVSALIAAHAPARYEQSINNSCPEIGTGFLAKEQMDEEEWEHTLFGGGFGSTMVIQDAGRMSQAEGKVPVLARQQPANVVSLLTMGRRAAKAKLRTQKLASLFDSALQEASDDCARTIGVQIHGSAISPANVATWTGTAADSTVSVDFADVRMFRPGAAYDFADVSSSKSYVIRCTSVTLNTVSGNTNSDAVAGTVAFINDVPNPVDGVVVALTDTAVATGDTIRTRGETAGFGGANTTISTALNNFQDLAGSSTLHGVTTAQVGAWRGHTKSVSASYSQEVVVQFMGRMFTDSGVIVDRVACHPQIAAAHIAYTGQTPTTFGLTAGKDASKVMTIDKSADKFGSVFENKALSVGGQALLQTPNCPAQTMEFWNSEKTKLAVWDEMGPDEEAGDPLLLGRTFFDVGAQISGAYNMITYKRNANGVLNAFSNL